MKIPAQCSTAGQNQYRPIIRKNLWPHKDNWQLKKQCPGGLPGYIVIPIHCNKWGALQKLSQGIIQPLNTSTIPQPVPLPMPQTKSNTVYNESKSTLIQSISNAQWVQSEGNGRLIWNYPPVTWRVYFMARTASVLFKLNGDVNEEWQLSLYNTELL